MKTLLFVVLFIPGLLAARTWTADDGRTMEAEFVKGDAQTVTVRMKGGRVMSFSLDKLSEADREWVAAKVKEEEQAEAAANGRSMAGLTGQWERLEEGGLPYRLYGGTELKATSRYPLLVYLHGRTGDVMKPDVPWVMGYFTKKKAYQDRPCLILAPQSPNGGTTPWRGDLKDQVLKVVKRLIDEGPVDEDRVYVTGYSMGGYGTFQLLASEPKLFAAGVPIAGGGNPGTAAAMKDIPMWVFHGDADDVVPVTQSRAMVEALERRTAPVKYTEMKGEGHGISSKVYQDEELHRWLFEQRRP